MNSTNSELDYKKNYEIACSFSAAFAITAVTISFTILILVWKSKPRLHTLRHLLICNTCVASILYCLVQSINYIFLLFLPDQTSDVGCRWRGYFSYVTIAGVAYSFLIQAISRLFISTFSAKHRWLTTFKVHYFLIGIQWCIAICSPLSAVITQDIHFRPGALCWVPLKKILHAIYTYFAFYIIPLVPIFIIYAYIYYRVRQSKKRATTLIRTINNEKRDLELLRNIVILLVIYLAGGIPTLLFLFTNSRTLYLTGISTISLAVCIEKVSTVLLDRDIREVLKNLRRKTTAVIPFDNTLTVGHTRKTKADVHHTAVLS